MHQVVRLVAAVACAGILTACAEPAFYCTSAAEVWRVTVHDAAGEPVTDLRWTVVVPRTNDTLSPSILQAASAPHAGEYAIFSEALRSHIDSTGETIHVEGASGLDWFTADLVFDIPDDECYANKVSGPDTVTLAPVMFRLVNGDRVWGSGDILVSSVALSLIGDSLPFLVGTDTVWSRARARDTVAVRAPALSGSYLVALVGQDSLVPLGGVVVRGYAGAAEGPPLSGIIQAWPRGSPDPTFLANGPNVLQLVDAASRSVVRTFPDSIHNPLGDFRDFGEYCPRGPGPTYDPDVFVLCPAPLSRVAWSIGDESPGLVEATCTTATGYRVVALMAPGRWLIGANQDVARVQCPEGTEWAPLLRVEETEYIRISPRGDRTLLLGNRHRDGGAPVLDASGAVAFRIAEFDRVGIEAGAGFSSDGSVLYAGMWGSAVGGIAVLALDATSGETLAATTLALGYPADLLVDPRGGWVYVLGVRAGQWVLAVLDPDSLGTVAILEPAGDVCAPEWPIGLVFGANQDAVFVVRTDGYWQWPSPSNSCIARFDVWR